LTLVLAFVGASIFWTSIGRAQTSCGEIELYLGNSGGSISACNQSQQQYTYVRTYEQPPYTAQDPLVVTFTGGKNNAMEPYFPSYETFSGSCEADRDKYSTTITIRFNKPVANFRTYVAHYMSQATDYVLVADNGSTATVNLAAWQWGQFEKRKERGNSSGR